MKDELQDAMMRHKKYDNIDGTGEMSMGLMLLGFALLHYIWTVLPEHSMWRTNFFGLMFMYAVLGLVLRLGYLVQRVIKKHITWPRTGYVAGHSLSLWRLMLAPRPASVEAAPGTPSRRVFWCVMLVICLASAVVAAGVAYLKKTEFEMKGALGLARVAYLAFWVPLYAFWVFRMEREHLWKWFIVLFMALGLAAIGFLAPAGFTELSRWVMLFVGLMWFISGGVTLYSYLRRTPPPDPMTE